ncbi:hypothetical protein TERMP_00783 [Thermococcus barophilus MP]|uniref:Uncharacterized protein n=2 Tax=Thermococcus barophilus TaxID=55802 RepID=F0LLA9_THEBM|nr:hypothetical protein TERMP_00783 [Thermococcus barophilus MP]
MIILGLPLTFTPVNASETTVVILVSDNEADCALADYIANITVNVNVVIVKTPWGIYNPNVTAEIISYAPDEVIIIGGPVAVPEEYVEDLQNLGINVERWWGQNRYETDLAVIKNATVRFQLQLQNRVVLVAGTDLAGIEKALQLAIRERAMIVLVNQTTNITKIMERLHVRAGNFTIIGTPAMNQTMLHIMKQLRKQECNCTELHLNITAERALEAIQIAEEKVNTAKELAENATNPALKTLLRIAEKQLEDAKDAYSSGKYGLAYGLAIAAKSKAEVVIRFAGEDIRKMIMSDIKMKLQREIIRVEAQLMVMERLGVNVTAALQLMEAIKAAVRNGDYDTAQELMIKLREELRTCYLAGRGIIKGKVHMPVRRREQP